MEKEHRIFGLTHDEFDEACQTAFEISKQDQEQILEEAHKIWLKEKNEIISKLNTIRRDKKTSETYKSWLEQTILFIKEGEI